MLRRQAGGEAESGIVVIAEEQTAGRGRLGRRWYSPAESGLYVSALFRTMRPVAEAPRWTIAAAVAVCESCRKAGAAQACIRWPNDVLHAGRKLAGILCELRSSTRGGAELVVGAGVNIRRWVGDVPRELRESAISLEEIAGPAAADREEFAVEYLARLGELAAALEGGDWTPLARRWESLSPGSRGSRVRLAPVATAERAAAAGVTAGIAPDGALRVSRDDGSTISVHTADAIVQWESGDVAGR